VPPTSSFSCVFHPQHHRNTDLPPKATDTGPSPLQRGGVYVGMVFFQDLLGFGQQRRVSLSSGISLPELDTPLEPAEFCGSAKPE